VLRAVDFGESDRVVHLLTPDAGRVVAIAKGAKRSSRRFPGTLDVLNRLRIQIVRRRPHTLARLEQAVLVTPFAELRTRPARFALACFLVEIFDRLAPGEGGGRDTGALYHFAVQSLTNLECSEPDGKARVLLELRALTALGLRPELLCCVRCRRGAEGERVLFSIAEGGPVCARCRKPREDFFALRLGTLRALAQSLRMPLPQLARLQLSARDVGAAQVLLRQLRHFHLGVELKSERFLDGALAVARDVAARA